MLTLPLDIKIKILSYLNYKELIRLSLVNSEFYNLSKNNYLWDRLIKDKYGYSATLNVSCHYKCDSCVNSKHKTFQLMKKISKLSFYILTFEECLDRDTNNVLIGSYKHLSDIVDYIHCDIMDKGKSFELDGFTKHVVNSNAEHYGKEFINNFIDNYQCYEFNSDDIENDFARFISCDKSNEHSNKKFNESSDDEQSDDESDENIDDNSNEKSDDESAPLDYYCTFREEVLLNDEIKQKYIKFYKEIENQLYSYLKEYIIKNGNRVIDCDDDYGDRYDWWKYIITKDTIKL